MKTYSSSKDSGLEWIGEIPTHWDITKIGYLSELLTGHPWKSSDFSYKEGIKIVRGENVSEGFLRWGSRTRKWNKEVVKGDTYYLNDGDIVIGMDGSKVGKNYVLITEEDLPLILHQRMCRVRTYEDLNPHFLKYFIGSPMFHYYIDISKTDPMVPHITQKNIFDFPISLPPLPEQKQIVEYLDKKTSKIERLVQSKQRKVELLKEKRTSLINQVVTKGLNPDVEMKDSGVEWIGEIPRVWDRKRLKHICDSVNGYSFKSDDFDKEYDVPVIRIGDVSDIIDFDECVKVKSHYLEDKSEFIIRRGDILIGLTGGTIGKSGRYHYDFPSLLNQRVGLLRNKSSVLNNLLYHYVKSDIFMRYIYYECYGGGQDNISMGEILNMIFPLPPLHEQHQIVEYLDKETKLIDETISSEQKKIELIKEYKQSLISEVVTGKRKVVN